MTWQYLWSRASEVTFGVTQPLWLLAFAAIGWFLYWGRYKGDWPLLVVVLRCVAWVAAVAVVAGVHLRVPLPELPRTIVALVDRSASIDEVGRRWQEQLLYELDRRKSPKDDLAVVVFAGQARVARWPEAGVSTTPLVAAPEPEATNLSAAFEAARRLLPDNRERKLVLLSDGNETRGNVASLLPVLRGGNTPVYPLIPPREQQHATGVAQLIVPKFAPAHTMVPVRALLLHHQSAAPATLRLWINDVMYESRTVELQPGTIPVTLQWLGKEPGAYRVTLEVEPHRGVYPVGAARESAEVTLTAVPRVLVVTPRAYSPLFAAARAQEFEVRRLRPDQVRARSLDWDAFHAVVWEEPTGQIAQAVWTELRRYVERGGGLAIVGGETTFGDLRLRSTDLASLSPVTFEPRRPPRPEREPLSLVVLIDRSNSMGYHIHDRMRRSDEESKLSYARRATLALVSQLRDSDRVGVIAFDSQMYEVAPLAPLAQNRGLLEHNVARLQPGGGTDFYDALQRATAELTRQRLRLGHIILLTDGDTNRSPAEHEPVLRILEDKGVSVTTVRIGDDTVNLEFLQSISKRTGGRFYHVRDASELPQLLLQDTSRLVTQEPRGGHAFAAYPGQFSRVVQGIAWDSAPPLAGYAYTRLKLEAEPWLKVAQGDRADPLLAAWNYGAGRVVAFTAGWNEGAEPWLAWKESATLWAQLLRWLLRETSPRDVAVGVQGGPPGMWEVWLEAFGDNRLEEARGRVVIGEQNQDLHFSRARGRRLVANVSAPAGVRGELALLVRWEGRPLEERNFALYFPREDVRGGEEVREPNRALLELLARETGGHMDARVEEIVASKRGGQRTEAKTLEWVLLPLAMFAFVGDVVARKIVLRQP